MYRWYVYVHVHVQFVHTCTCKYIIVIICTCTRACTHNVQCIGDWDSQLAQSRMIELGLCCWPALKKETTFLWNLVYSKLGYREPLCTSIYWYKNYVHVHNHMYSSWVMLYHSDLLHISCDDPLLVLMVLSYKRQRRRNKLKILVVHNVRTCTHTKEAKFTNKLT